MALTPVESPVVRTTVARSQHECSVVTPYRLDLTVSVLRRLPSNLTDVFTPGRVYLRAICGVKSVVVARVAQTDPGTLVISLEGEEGEHSRALWIVRRVLGVDRDLAHFDRSAARITWLKSLAKRMRGVRPPRYPTLWEACVNAVVFQQLSLVAATVILRRLIVALGQAFVSAGFRHYSFPGVTTFLAADDDLLLATGLSARKLQTLRRVGEALATGMLDETVLEQQTSRDATAILREIKGIGPWTAALILLRGLGRLDVFPMNDTSVTHNLGLVSRSAVDLESALRTLSPQQGMLYYHLLLARLEAQRDLYRPSVNVSWTGQ